MNKDIVGKFFPEAVNDFENGVCPFCKKVVDTTQFKNELSKKEFGISGLCQKCQDKFFK